MARRGLVVSPLSLNQLTRDYWGQYDPAVIAQLAPLANDPCYTQKFYKAPGDNQEVIEGYGFVTYGMRFSPGSIIYGIYQPMILDLENPTASVPLDFTVQIYDVSLDHLWFDDPVSSLMLSNLKPEYQDTATINTGSLPNLLVAPYPVTGSGQIDVQIQSTSAEDQRIQLIFGVLEVCNVS
jgi:hypothetical protein